MHSLEEVAIWGTFLVAAAGVASLYAAYSNEIKEERNEAKASATAGEAQRYNPVVEIPEDRETYYAYFCRLGADQQKRMPVPSVPIYFRIQPKNSFRFQQS